MSFIEYFSCTLAHFIQFSLSVYQLLDLAMQSHVSMEEPALAPLSIIFALAQKDLMDLAAKVSRSFPSHKHD